MNESEDSQWSAPQHYDHMNSQVSDNDFSNFLDLDLGDIEFPVFDTNGPPSREPSQQLNELPDGMHMQHPNTSGFHSTQTLAANSHPQHAQQFRPSQNAGSQDHSNTFFDLNMPLYNSAQSQYGFQSEQPRFVPHSAIPPTPNSLEIHAGFRQMTQQQPQHQHMDPHNQQVYQLRKDDAASFTPLVSPAVTPREAAFRVPQDFTVPGAYFSPLSSPALVAEKHRHMDHHTPGNSGSSAATSPADVNMDMLESVVQDSARKTKTGSTTRKGLPRSSTMSKIKQSPIHRARRKSRPSQAMTPKEIAMIKEAEATFSMGSRPYSRGAGLDIPRSSDGSEASISPEPLTESLMGPPPRPGSVSQSPALLAKKSGLQAVQNLGVAPATPASLMRLQNSPNGMSPSMRSNSQGNHMGTQMPVLEDLTLPEAVESDLINASQDDAATPRVVPRKTPKLNPLMTPSSGAALSGRPSPSLSAITSPTTPIAQSPATMRRADPKGRNSKKRNSVSSTIPSPALRPKISPSIKPLLPDSAQGMTDDAHTLLLATKSNYQNLLEGTHVPGVTYPEALSTNLTSKRTSHKIAEQGRRNRINNALQEMQALLASPVSVNAAGKAPKAEARSPEGDVTSPGNGKAASAAAQANSKAATVELAIDYIKTLQRERTEQEEKMRTKDRELDELRKKMSEMESQLRATSETSSQGAS